MKCFKKKKHTSIINIINIIAAGMTVRKIPAYAPRQPAWLSCPHALSGHLSLLNLLLLLKIGDFHGIPNANLFLIHN